MNRTPLLRCPITFFGWAFLVSKLIVRLPWISMHGWNSNEQTFSSDVKGTHRGYNDDILNENTDTAKPNMHQRLSCPITSCGHCYSISEIYTVVSCKFNNITKMLMCAEMCLIIIYIFWFQSQTQMSKESQASHWYNFSDMSSSEQNQSAANDNTDISPMPTDNMIPLREWKVLGDSNTWLNQAFIGTNSTSPNAIQQTVAQPPPHLLNCQQEKPNVSIQNTIEQCFLDSDSYYPYQTDCFSSSNETENETQSGAIPNFQVRESSSSISLPPLHTPMTNKNMNDFRQMQILPRKTRSLINWWVLVLVHH